MDCRTGLREMLGIEGPLTRERLELALYDYLIRGAINPGTAGRRETVEQDAKGAAPPPPQTAEM